MSVSKEGDSEQGHLHLAEAGAHTGRRMYVHAVVIPVIPVIPPVYPVTTYRVHCRRMYSRGISDTRASTVLRTEHMYILSYMYKSTKEYSFRLIIKYKPLRSGLRRMTGCAFVPVNCWSAMVDGQCSMIDGRYSMRLDQLIDAAVITNSAWLRDLCCQVSSFCICTPTEN